MKITSREIIIAVVAILVLLGIGYFINNNNSQDNSGDSNQEDQVNLDENNSDENKDEEVKADLPEGVASTSPEDNAEIALTDVPATIIVKLDRQITAGSAIEVVSDKNIDVVTGGNRITTDLKQLSAPVNITVPGTYTVTYKVNWNDGGSANGTYKFVVK